VSAEAPSKPVPPAPHGRAQLRIWLHRLLAAVGIPAVLLLGLEASLRVAGFGQSVRFLIPDDKPGYFRTNPEFVSSFLPNNFDLRPLNYRVSRAKPSGTVRIVILGESAAQGVPAPSFGFARQLRAQLRARYPGKTIEVLNTGIVAINSHVVYQVACELAGFSPDLFVVYMGNNEVVGPYGPGCAYLSEMPPLWVIRLSVFVRSTRTGQLVSAAMARLPGGRRPPREWGGMAMFVNNAVPGDDPRLEAVYRNFESNLRDIVRAAHGAGAATVLCTVASNIRDSAPFLSVHRPGMSPADLEAWKAAFDRGRTEWLLGDTVPARVDMAEALRIDPQFADASYIMGSLDFQDGNAGALRELLDAEHWDALRFRPDPRINQAVRAVARDNPGVALVDAAMAMGSDPLSESGPAGREAFFEHVHFDWAGNYRLALMIAEKSEGVLFPSGRSAPPWLDEKACAAAVGYTPHERFAVLGRLRAIVQNPPFTNQLTYCEDEARLSRDASRAGADRSDRSQTLRALDTVKASEAADPDNADLAKTQEDLDDDLGDLAGALADTRRAQELQPASFALATDEAIKLSRLGRYAESEQLLVRTASAAGPADAASMAPAFADLYVRTKRYEDGRRYIDREIARRPSDASLVLIRCRLDEYAGDDASAERGLRGVLAADPGNQAALEALVSLLGKTSQPEAAAAASLAALDAQPANQANNLRSAIIYDRKGDISNSVGCLLASEASGPVTSAVEMRIARRYFEERDAAGALLHLARARRVSLYEGDPKATATIDDIVGRLRARSP